MSSECDENEKGEDVYSIKLQLDVARCISWIILYHLGRNGGYITLLKTVKFSINLSARKKWMEIKVPTASPSPLHGLHFCYLDRHTLAILTYKGMEVLWLHLPRQNATVAYFGTSNSREGTSESTMKGREVNMNYILALKAFGSFKIPLALEAMDNISLKSLKFTPQPSAQFLLFHGFVLRLRSSSLVENCQTWKPSESVRPRQVKDPHC